MCLMLYVGADRELPTTKAWDQDKPAFHVIPEPDPIPAITHHLQTKYVYYVGSHEGCGFGYESSQEYRESLSANIPDDVKAVVKEYRVERITCMNELREYLSRITLEGSVKLLVTWADREDAEIEHISTVSPSFFGGDECYLAENSLFEIEHGNLP